jgi:hypothetical protein
MILYKKVEVFWRDAFTIDGWHSLADVNKKVTEGADCQTVGYLIQDTQDWLVVAATVGRDISEDCEIGSCWIIPRGMITKMVDIPDVA